MKRHAPATARNREPIAAVLAGLLPDSGRVLEIASGTGEHAAFFAGRFPGIEWQPSDVDAALLASIAAHREEAGLANLLAPVRLDVLDDWPSQVDGRFDAVFCANMIHIAPWDCGLGLLAGAAEVLASGSPLLMYGPFVRDGVETAPSNLAFDRSLRSHEPTWGIRRLEDVVDAAVGFELDEVVEMPANNIIAVLRRAER